MRLEHLRQPDADPVGTQREAERDRAENPDARILQRCLETVAVMALALFFSQHARDQLTLAGCQPFGFCRVVGQHLQRDQPQNTGRHPFDDEHPLPTCEAKEAMHLQEPNGQWPAYQE
ncbi:hypothetical protein D3C78_1048390 [compost metagenome]